jgi:hypothetical protein
MSVLNQHPRDRKLLDLDLTTLFRIQNQDTLIQEQERKILDLTLKNNLQEEQIRRLRSKIDEQKKRNLIKL